MRRPPLPGRPDGPALAAARGRRARRFAVRLLNARQQRQTQLLRRLLGPSSWRCHPHAASHPEREPGD